MNLPASDLEPAVRDPKKLRRTAWILVAIMILGGTVILTAYNKRAAATAEDDRPARIYRITKERDLRFQRQDGTVVDLHELEGKVVAIQTISLAHPEVDEISMKAMRQLQDRFRDETDFVLLTLLVDPLPREELESTLETVAARHDIRLPQWWLGTTTPDPLHKFIKNQLKTSIFPHEPEGGGWKYDSSIVLLDRQRHLRRAVVPQRQGGPPYVATFDFAQAKEWDDRQVKTGTDLNNFDQLQELLIQTIEKVLAEPPL
jgi:cytochrome oxidase Cu insertion factor (SCO1/SenC/PrrC family)